MFLSTIINSDSHPLYLFVFLKRRRASHLLNLFVFMRDVNISPPRNIFFICLAVVCLTQFPIFVIFVYSIFRTRMKIRPGLTDKRRLRDEGRGLREKMADG